MLGQYNNKNNRVSNNNTEIKLYQLRAVYFLLLNIICVRLCLSQTFILDSHPVSSIYHLLIGVFTINGLYINRINFNIYSKAEVFGR